MIVAVNLGNIGNSKLLFRSWSIFSGPKTIYQESFQCVIIFFGCCVLLFCLSPLLHFHTNAYQGSLSNFVILLSIFVASVVQVDVKRSMEEGENRFNQLSIEERGKFDEETLVNVNNIRRKSSTSQRATGFSNEYIVVRMTLHSTFFIWNFRLFLGRIVGMWRPALIFEAPLVPLRKALINVEPYP